VIKKLFYYLLQALFTGYCLFSGAIWNGLFYMFLIGLANIVVCFFIASRKRSALIISLIYYLLIFLVYSSMFFFMIIASIKEQYINPFFMMAAEIQAPVFLYSTLAVILLGRHLRKKYLLS